MRTLSSKIRTLFAIFILVLVAESCQSQWQSPLVGITENDTVGYSIFQEERNEIENIEHLKPFFQKMMRQRVFGGEQINIVHLGDSHILGNYLTAEVRQRLQRAFGDAGRGIIFPYKLVNSNGPQDYLVSTTSRWSGTNCARDLSEVKDYGISGFTALNTQALGDLTFRLKDTTSGNTSTFTRVTVFYRNNANAPEISLVDETTQQKAKVVLEDNYSKTFFFDRPVAECTIKPATNTPGKKLWLDGISIDNERSGVIYHSIGVNGAKFSDFARSKHFARQLREVAPDLVVLSFGTNEAQAKHYPEQLERQMEELCTQILQQWPHTAILFTTPADSYLRGKGLNPYLPEVSETICQFARKKGFAIWDLFQITGGANSSATWKSLGLLSTDSVHYTKNGYKVQGKILYQGLIKAYNEVAKTYLPSSSAEDGK